jgi:hypothetical protein
VLASADSAHIEGGGFSSSISGFGTGIAIDGSNSVVSEVELLKNENCGVAISGSNNAIYDLDAGKPTDATSGNGVAGVCITGDNNLVDDIHADHNGMYGIKLSGVSFVSVNNVLHDLDADFNGIYGIWLNRSSGSRVVNSTGNSNGQIGLFIGCPSSGGVGGSCECLLHPCSSSKVVVKFSQWNSNTTAGIEVASGDLANQIGLNQMSSNGTADAVDANALCGTNLWFLDMIGTTPAQTCVK